MRVVSQDGMIDVSYENGSLVICACKSEDVKGAGIYYHDSSSTRGTKLAEYSRKTKAIKAMEMLREAYRGKPQRTKSGNVMIDYTANHIFQFPKDEDVEVNDEKD